MASADPAELTKFSSIRSAMQNACLVYGTRSMGLYAVPEAHAQETADKLEELKAEFYALKAKFLAQFEKNRDEWLAKPEFAAWTDKIRARLDSVSHVDASLYIDFQPFVLGSTKDLPGATDDESPLAAGMVRARNGIEDQACKELAAMAKTLMDQSFFDDKGNQRTEVTQKILSPIRRILDKADALSFAAPNLRHVISYSKAVLSQLPVKGKMTDGSLTSVFNLVDALQRPESIIRNAILSTNSSHEMTAEDSKVLQEILDSGSSATATLPLDLEVQDDLVSSSNAASASELAPATDETAPATVNSAPAETQMQTSTASAAPGDVVYDDIF